MAETVEVMDAEVIEVQNTSASILVGTKEEYDTVANIARTYGVEALPAEGAIDPDGNPCIKLTLVNVSDEALSKISRKVTIESWSHGIVNAANKVSGFVTDTADFALNGAIVPAAVETTAAVARVAGCGSRAAITMACGVGNAILVEGYRSATELANDPTVKASWSNLKMIGSSVGKKLFGTSFGKFTRSA